MKEYILIFPDTFLWYNEKMGLFYNVVEKNIFQFVNNVLIHRYCKELANPINLYSVLINPEHKEDNLFMLWLDGIKKNKIGLIPTLHNDVEKPISFPPILNLINEIEDSQLDKSTYYSPINYSEYFNELSLYLGGSSLPQEEAHFYKQILYPLSSQVFLDPNKLKRFFETSNKSYLRQINIICSYVSNYPFIGDLFLLLKKYKIPTTFYILGDDIDGIKKILKFTEVYSFSVKLFFKDVKHFLQIDFLLKQSDVSTYNWIFLIKNENDYCESEEIIDIYNLKESNILLPVLTKENLDFFEENVFTSNDDIYNSLISKQQIFCNQTLNSNMWGSLFVLPNGLIFSNLNRDPIGSIDDDVIKLIKNEVKDLNSSWRWTRARCFPCKDCLFRYLCPPPSNYEFYLNKFDLCSIKMI